MEMESFSMDVHGELWPTLALHPQFTQLANSATWLRPKHWQFWLWKDEMFELQKTMQRPEDGISSEGKNTFIAAIPPTTTSVEIARAKRDNRWYPTTTTAKPKQTALPEAQPRNFLLLDASVVHPRRTVAPQAPRYKIKRYEQVPCSMCHEPS